MKKTIALLALSCIFVSANAASLDVAGQFNAFVFGNATLSGGESEGAMAIKGNLTTGNPYQIAFDMTAPGLPVNANNVGLYVGGNVNFASGQLDAGKVMGGNAYIAGNIPTNNVKVFNGTLNPGGSSVDPNVFTNAHSHLTSLSSTLSSLSSQSLVGAPQNMSINLATNTLNSDPNLKVYNLNAATLNQLGTINFSNFTGAETIVFNVTGTTVDWSMQVNNQGSNPNSIFNRILWNFQDATQINVTQRGLAGTILAPNANVLQSQLIQGTLIANNWDNFNSPEIHNYLFTGNLESVPEPCTMTLLALLALRRRKKKQAVA